MVNSPSLVHLFETADFVKSTKSGSGGSNCVEVARAHGLIGVRDSKNRSGPVLIFAPTEWNAFLDGIRDGEFD